MADTMNNALKENSVYPNCHRCVPGSQPDIEPKNPKHTNKKKQFSNDVRSIDESLYHLAFECDKM